MCLSAISGIWKYKQKALSEGVYSPGDSGIGYQVKNKSQEAGPLGDKDNRRTVYFPLYNDLHHRQYMGVECKSLGGDLELIGGGGLSYPNGHHVFVCLRDAVSYLMERVEQFPRAVVVAVAWKGKKASGFQAIPREDRLAPVNVVDVINISREVSPDYY